jgi:glycosyltransferase involved in cell wall biosynthesis
VNTPAVAALVDELGLGDRVRLLGPLPRHETLAEMARADAVLFPSVRDSMPWVPAEAASIGVPTVAFDFGGPATVVRLGTGVTVPSTGDVVANFAAALGSLPAVAPVDRWSEDRLPDLLDEWYAMAIRGVPGGGEGPGGDVPGRLA